MPLLLLLGACGGGGGGSDSPSTAVRYEPAPPRTSSEPSGPAPDPEVSTQPEPEVSTPEPVEVTLAPTGGSRDTSIKHVLFPSASDREPMLDRLLEPKSQLEWGSSTPFRLSRFNPSSNVHYAQPHFDIPLVSQYGLNVVLPEEGAAIGWPRLNLDDYNAFESDAMDFLTFDGEFTFDEAREQSLYWYSTIDHLIRLGYHQWVRHLDYDPGRLIVNIEKINNPNTIAYYNTVTNEVTLGSDWLIEQFYYLASGDNAAFQSAVSELIITITHEAAHQFGYENPNGITEGCGDGSRCHAPYGSSSVVSYDHHNGDPVNYGVTEEDIRHIPRATYNDDTSTAIKVTKDSPIAEYGVWVTHVFNVTVSTDLGSPHEGNFAVADWINAYPEFDFDRDLVDSQLPSGSATYSGEDNFIGADMSAHYLGHVLRADASVVYQFGSATTGDMSLTIDEFEVYRLGDWLPQDGSITYRLDCSPSACTTNVDETTLRIGFFDDSQYVGGEVKDYQNEYVGAFVAERD